MSEAAAADAVVTLAERKARELARRSAAIARVSARLAEFARANGGRYLTFGSAARGEMNSDSDLDILIDFPLHMEAAAWRFAEDICADEGLPVDIMPLSSCSDWFVDYISSDLRVLP